MDNSPTESQTQTANPFLCNAPNSVCIVCNKKLKSIKTVPLQEILPHYEPAISLFEGLKLLANVEDVNIDKVPQRACNTCYLNTDGFLRFQNACRKAADNIKGYILNQETIPHQIAEDEAECNASSSSDDNSGSIYAEDDQPEEVDINWKTWNETEIKKNQERRKFYRRTKPTIKPTIKPKVECTVCHKLLARHSIKSHMHIHTGEKPHQCTQCDRTFRAQSSLAAHTKLYHSGDDYPFLCPICGKKYKVGGHLTGHMKLIHSDVRPNKCETCGKAYKTRGQLKDHFVTHTGEKNFQCEKCPKKFSSRKLLNQHSWTHDEIRRIECTFCGKRFTQPHCLRLHQAKSCEVLRAGADNSNPI